MLRIKGADIENLRGSPVVQILSSRSAWVFDTSMKALTQWGLGMVPDDGAFEESGFEYGCKFYEQSGGHGAGQAFV